MDSARAGGGNAYPEFARELGIAACHKRGRLLMSHLDEKNFFLAGAKGFNDAVDSIARHPQFHIYIPIQQTLDEHISRSHCVDSSDWRSRRAMRLLTKSGLRMNTYNYAHRR